MLRNSRVAFPCVASACVCVLLVASGAHGVTTSWLTITGNGPNDDPLISSHLLTLPGYGGTATVTKLGSTGSGGLHLRKIAHYAPGTFAAYPSQGLDPTGADNYAVVGTTPDSGNTVTVRFDFSNLTNGYLPAGAIFMAIDIDTAESINRLSAFNGGQIVTPWLALQSQFDTDTINDASTFAPFSFTGGAYDFGPNTINSDVPGQYFLTTQNITHIEFIGTADFGPRGPAIAFGIHVPEPTSIALLGLCCGAIAVGIRRRK